MTMPAPIEDLQRHQTLLLENVRRASAADYNRQFHPDLSPLGWHLGHCVFTENYWLREVLLDDASDSAAQKSLYVPELMPKTRRAAALPQFEELCRWARQSQRDNLDLLRLLLDSGRDDPLLREDYLAHFLNQHYAQHYETTLYVLAQRRQQQDDGAAPGSAAPARAESPSTAAMPAGEYRIGAGAGTVAYDNERPAFRARLGAFRIAVRPVSNAEYLRFMAAGGYREPGLWCEAGWRWRRELGIEAPEHWRRDEHGRYYGIDETGPVPLAPGAPVYGLSYYEARAFAVWAGARLPHEYEWEAARRAGVLEDDGCVWEWCSNAFHPYAGFTAFPYEGYSVPYFDNNHYTLRGGSVYTRPCIRRPSFRNYYEPDKRHIRAGLRLAWS